MARKFTFLGKGEPGADANGFGWVDEADEVTWQKNRELQRQATEREALINERIAQNAWMGETRGEGRTYHDPQADLAYTRAYTELVPQMREQGLIGTTPAVVTGTPDTGTPDTGTPDTGTPDTGTGVDEPWMPQTLTGDTVARPSPGDYAPSVRGANAAQIRAGNVFPCTNIPLTAIPAGQRQQYIDRLNADIAEDPTGRRANDVIFEIAFAASTQAQRDAGGQGSPHIGAVQSGMWKLNQGPLWPEMNINSSNDRYFIRDPNTGVRTGDIVRYDDLYGVVRGGQEEGTGRFVPSNYLGTYGGNEAAGIVEGLPTLFPPTGGLDYGITDLDEGGLLGTSGGTFGTGTASPYYADAYSVPSMQTGGLWEGLGAEYQPGTTQGLGLLAGDPYTGYQQMAQGMLGAQPSYMAPTNGILGGPFRFGLSGTTGET